MKFREFSENSRQSVETPRKSLEERMVEQADEINRLLAENKIEDDDFEKGISDIDQKWIRENESKEYKFTVPAQEENDENINKQYLSEVESLALQKIRNDLLFEGMLNEAIRRLSSIGLNVTREGILKDIEREIVIQKTSLTDSENIRQESKQASNEKDEIASKTDYLLSNLGRIFEGVPFEDVVLQYDNEETKRSGMLR